MRDDLALLLRLTWATYVSLHIFFILRLYWEVLRLGEWKFVSTVQNLLFTRVR